MEQQVEQQEENKIFRQKAIDRVSSPEELNSYLRVATPQMWMVLVAILVLLIGVCVWGIYGILESNVECVAIVTNGTAVCYVPKENIGESCPGDPVYINDKQYTIKSITDQPVQVPDDFPEYAKSEGNLTEGQWVYMLEADTKEENGIYQARIVDERIQPFSFIVGNSSSEE